MEKNDPAPKGSNMPDAPTTIVRPLQGRGMLWSARTPGCTRGYSNPIPSGLPDAPGPADV